MAEQPQTDILTFQGLILALQQYWAEQGCVVVQPLDMEVGAGTFHPSTFLRAIGPENWNSAYVQPSRRPTDGRYGENPNRLQHYYQFQVILKPSPLDLQDLYLQSLYRLGIDPPRWTHVPSREQTCEAGAELGGYPVRVRPAGWPQARTARSLPATTG